MTYKLTNTSQPADPYYGAVSLLLHGDDLLDSSVNPKTLTAYGDAAVSTAQSKFNGASLAFDGTGDFISTNTSADLRMGTDEFTIEFWFYPTSTANNQYILTSASGTQGWSTMGFNFFTTGTGKIECKSAAPGANAKSVTDPSINTFTVNAWNHVAAVKNVAAGRYYLYLNGVRNNGLTIAFSGDQLEPFTVDPYVTAGGFGSGWNFGDRFNGYIDDIRITKGVCRYTAATFTPPTQPFQSLSVRDPQFNAVSLLLKGEGVDGSTTIVDSSPTPKTVTAVGDAQISTAESKFSTSSLYFDGSGDYLSTGPDSNLALGSGDFTVEAFIYVTSLSSDSVIASSRVLNVTGNLYWAFSVSSTGQLSFQSRTSAGTQYFAMSATSAITTNTWYHVAAVRQSNVLTVYIDGAAGPTTANDGGNNLSENYVGIGIFNFPNYENYFSGYIDDLRITKGVARYTSNFTPPGPLPTY